MSIDDKVPKGIEFIGQIKEYKVYIDIKHDVLYKRKDNGPYVQMFMHGGAQNGRSY